MLKNWGSDLGGAGGKRTEADKSNVFYKVNPKVDDIPETYGKECSGVRLLVLGTVMSQFVQNLRLNRDQYALLDMEAGVEHFGRGIDNGADLILMIVDPSYESLQLTKKIGELAESIGKPYYYICNKAMEEEQNLVKQEVWSPDRIAACLMQDPAILKEGLRGQELKERPEEIEKLADFLIRLSVEGNKDAEGTV
ncbi:MAG TPA: hypothetical protein IAB54_05760 [Candidatus Scatomonas merdigallinarum]|nr:hypothetical protein [Candidatus Scatomonas merdigallinarum]